MTPWVQMAETTRSSTPSALTSPQAEANPRMPVESVAGIFTCLASESSGPK